MNNNRNRASNNFEKLYNPNKQNFNLEDRRNKNLKILESIIDEIKNVDKKYSESKRQIILDVSSDDSIINKDKVIDEQFEIINDCIEADRKKLYNKLRNTINHQVKYLLILKEPNMMYEYYKLITTIPLMDEYADLESELYREFLMRNPAVENIIISYSILEDEINDNKNKDEKEEKYAEVEKLVDEAEKLRTKKSVIAAEKEVEKLPECEEKKRLLAKLKATKLLMFDDFETKLRNLKTIRNENLTYDEVTNLRNLFNELVDVEDVSNAKKSLYAKDLITITNAYNEGAQNRLKSEIAENEPKKVKLSDRIAEFGSSLVKGILGTKLAKRIRKESLRRAIENGNDEKAEKIKNKIKENDIINGVRLFTARNKLASLKPALYKGELLGVNTNGLSNKERRKLAKNQEAYFRSKNNVDALLNNKLTDLIEDEDIINDSERVLVVISQFLKQLSVSDDVEMDSKDLVDFLIKALNKGSLSATQFNSYMDEIESIKYYMTYNPDSIYEISLDEINEKTAEYYENPITYKDGDEVKALPHIKSYNRK